MIQLTQPPYLQKGDTLAIVAPSGVLTAKNEAVYAAKKLAESWGLTVVLGAHVFADNFHFAGTDTQRLEDLQEALDNPTVKAIWCARGGYGAVRIIDQLDFTAFQKHPKWLIGYSDVTVLHSHLHTLGFETMHALMGSSFIDPLADHSQSIDSFKKGVIWRVTYLYNSCKPIQSKRDSNWKISGRKSDITTKPTRLQKRYKYRWKNTLYRRNRRVQIPYRSNVTKLTTSRSFYQLCWNCCGRYDRHQTKYTTMGCKYRNVNSTSCKQPEYSYSLRFSCRTRYRQQSTFLRKKRTNNVKQNTGKPYF